MRRPAFGLVAMTTAIILIAAGVFFGSPFANGADDPPAADSSTSDRPAADRPAAKRKATAGGVENPFPNGNAAPALEGGVGWLNTSGPITLKDLRGKVVLLDFWTYCCINCMHVLPDLEYLEEKYADELVVIGVHSAKFDNEKDSEAIREAILRYEIAHPVINDADMLLWRKFGVRAWPTFVLIDPEGNYCGFVSGEGNREIVDQAIEKVIAFHDAKGTLDRTPVRFDLERYAQPETPLRYPGKLLADVKANRLYVSDSNHNRIVVTDLDGKLIETIGSGRLGRADGSYAEAEFDHPQGMTLDGGTLYVADTENHLIRTVDLATKQVATLAGTGKQANFRETGGVLKAANLNSPWDLLIHDKTLYIAMAGPHQIWSHALGSDRIGSFAGSGREDILDGPRAKAAFAQPSGLVSDGEAIYVCDSEGSAIRRVPFDARKAVTTVAGPSDLPNGQSLFTFGDVDAAGNKARLQHPLGIAFRDGVFYIADSYNHKLKTIRLDRNGVGVVETFLGTGKAGDALDPVQFSEPAGLAIAGDSLFVADTNNHRIVRIDLQSKQASVFDIAGLTPPATGGQLASTAPEQPETQAMAAPSQTVRPGENVAVQVELSLPAEFKLNPAFPLTATVTSEDTQSIVASESVGKRIKAQGKDQAAQFTLPLTGQAGEAALRVRLDYGYCRDGEGGLCKVGTAEWLLRLTIAEGGTDTVRLSAAPAEASAEN